MKELELWMVPTKNFSKITVYSFSFLNFLSMSFILCKCFKIEGNHCAMFSIPA